MRRLQTRIPGSVTKDRLDLFLSEWLPHAVGKPVSKTQIRLLIQSGAVYVNRHRNRIATSPVFTGAMIEVYYDEERMNQKTSTGETRMAETRFDSNRIVFEDDYLIIVDKPTGLPTQPTVDPNRANLFELMKKFFAERDERENPYVGLHHRLDKDTSGLVLFTKKEEANKGVATLFAKHMIQKTYHCLCWRGPGSRKLVANEEFTIENHLGRVSEQAGKTKYGEVTSGGDRAITEFRAIEVFRDIYWLQARPKTGRTHQIRVHCSEDKLPILGDSMYFPEKISAFVVSPRLMLHAGELKFIHPITQQEIIASSPLPQEFVQLLGQLKA